MRFWAALLLSILIMPQLAAGGPKLLSDEELDQITAQGVDLKLSMSPDQQQLDFTFEAQSTAGQGSVAVSPSSFPSTLTVNGMTNLDLSRSTILVGNLTLNLNICVQCKATTIIQQGFGFPVTVTIQP